MADQETDLPFFVTWRSQAAQLRSSGGRGEVDLPRGAELPTEVTESGVVQVVSPRVRRAFGLLERFAPAIGSRWAVELWCTPPVVEMSLRMPPGVSAGEPLEAFWDGHRIAGEAWGEGPNVYLVHGWGGCRAHMAVFVKPLVDAGHRVIAFDLPRAAGQ